MTKLTMSDSYKIIETSITLPIYFLGPELNKGPLPAIFYFALSAEDTLGLDPYNQPALFLAKNQLRIFSVSLPEHRKDKNPVYAMKDWATNMLQGSNIVQDFSHECQQVLNFLISEGYIGNNPIGVCGLSRGGFMAAHFAALDSRIGSILCFAPLTNLLYLEEFKPYSTYSIFNELSLINLTSQLVDKKICCFIGNHDERVGTNECYLWISTLIEAGYNKHHRPPQIELSLFPSVGHKGHGTPPSIFQKGADWILKTVSR